MSSQTWANEKQLRQWPWPWTLWRNWLVTIWQEQEMPWTETLPFVPVCWLQGSSPSEETRWWKWEAPPPRRWGRPTEGVVGLPLEDKKKTWTVMLWCSGSTNPDYIFALRRTSAILQHHLHCAPQLALPAAAGRRRALHLLGNLPLPQVDLQTVVEQEQGCRREDGRQKHHNISDWPIACMSVIAYRWIKPEELSMCTISMYESCDHRIIGIL